MKTKKILLEICTALLIILFVYTPASKLMTFHEYVLSMRAQPLQHWLSSFLTYAVPISELIAVVLLISGKFRKQGLYLSLGLLLIFTGYISLVQLNYYGRIPCSCGGVIRYMTWNQHLFFNLFFIAITGIAIWLNKTNYKHTLAIH